MEYPSSISASDILWEQYCDDLEKAHNLLLTRLNELGEEAFRKEIYESCDLSLALTYIHPDDNIKTLEKFSIIQSAFINAIV